MATTGTMTVTIEMTDEVRAMFDEAKRQREQAAVDLRALTRDIRFWDMQNPRFGLTTEQVAEVLWCIDVVADRLQPTGKTPREGSES